MDRFSSSHDFFGNDNIEKSRKFGEERGLEGYDHLVSLGVVDPSKTVEEIAAHAVRLAMCVSLTLDVDQRVAARAVVESLESRSGLK